MYSVCKTIVPDTFHVFLSQWGRWLIWPFTAPQCLVSTLLVSAMSRCFSPLPLTTNPILAMTHLDDLNDSHIEESEVVSATRYQGVISLSQSSASITLVWPWFNPSRCLSLSWPFDRNGLTVFLESHTKTTATPWYRHYLSSSQCCHAIISLVFCIWESTNS